MTLDIDAIRERWRDTAPVDLLVLLAEVERLWGFRLALERIAKSKCQIRAYCSTADFHYKCVSCIARAALAEQSGSEL